MTLRCHCCCYFSYFVAQYKENAFMVPSLSEERGKGERSFLIPFFLFFFLFFLFFLLFLSFFGVVFVYSFFSSSYIDVTLNFSHVFFLLSSRIFISFLFFPGNRFFLRPLFFPLSLPPLLPLSLLPLLPLLHHGQESCC